MRIIYIHQHFATPQMAGGTRSYEFAKRLVARGHHVTMIAGGMNRVDKSELKKTIEDGIEVHWIPISYSNKMNYRKRINAFMKFAWLAYRCASKVNCDLVFATSTPLTVAIPGIYAARRHQVPFIFEVRDLWPEMPIAVNALKNRWAIALARHLERFAYKNAKHIIALSPGMRDGIASTGYPISRISVIPNFCNPKIFNNNTRLHNSSIIPAEFADKQIALYAGTIGVLNNLSYLVDVAYESKSLDANLIYVVVGDGADRENVIKKAKKLEVLGVNFFVLPQASKEQIPAFFQRADITFSLFADIEEMWANSANKFFDGLASGTPVAINYKGWQAEILLKYDAGIVMPPSDSKKSAQMISELVKDKSRRARMAQNAIALATGEYSDECAYLNFERVLLSSASQLEMPLP